MRLAIYTHRRVRRPAPWHKHDFDFSLETEEYARCEKIYKRVCLKCQHRDRVLLSSDQGGWGHSLYTAVTAALGVPVPTCKCWRCVRARAFGKPRKRRQRPRRFRRPLAEYDIRGRVTDAHIAWCFREPSL
jgi:hypothetical protein